MLTFMISVTALTALLAVIWACLRLVEINDKLRYHEYSLNLAFYNDLIAHTNSLESISEEQEFNISVLQDQLSEQARSMGLEFVPFHRPKDITD